MLTDKADIHSNVKWDTFFASTFMIQKLRLIFYSYKFWFIIKTALGEKSVLNLNRETFCFFS